MSTTDEGEIIVIDGPLPPIEEIVRAHNPYGSEMKLAGAAPQAALQLAPVLELAGLARDNNAQNPLFKEPSEMTVQEWQQMLYWFFGGKQVGVVKALRIPFQFTANGIVRKSHLLIGFELQEE